MKKLVALILALVMVLGISAAFADEYHFEIVSKGFQSTYWQAVLKGAKEEVDKINDASPAYRKIKRVILRKSDFIHNTSSKLIRFAEENKTEGTE